MTLLASVPHGERMANTNCGGVIWYIEVKPVSQQRQHLLLRLAALEQVADFNNDNKTT